MGDEMQGAVFGGPLERLRQCARVDLPRLADEYAKVRDGCQTSAGSDGLLDRPDYFGSPRLKDAFTPLRDVVWTAVGATGRNLWDLSRGLDTALDGFVEHDTAAKNVMNGYKAALDSDTSTGNDEWTGGYHDGDYPGKGR